MLVRQRNTVGFTRIGTGFRPRVTEAKATTTPSATSDNTHISWVNNKPRMSCVTTFIIAIKPPRQLARRQKNQRPGLFPRKLHQTAGGVLIRFVSSHPRRQQVVTV